MVRRDGTLSGGAAGVGGAPPRRAAALAHLDRLESESIGILRETAAAFRHPVMLWSGGKDSSVLLELALRAFAPGRLPFPLLHVDTGWKFREALRFRDETAARHGLELIVHTNPDGVARGVGPLTHGSGVHTDVMKTEALRQALALHGFDAALGGARRDEEASRSKERVYSLRAAGQRWDPARQRPEPWGLCNPRLGPGESVRVFPLSDWTELDVWRYVAREGVAVAPLYFAAPRPVVRRGGALIVRDDDRLPLGPGEAPEQRTVRFRSLGCWPLTAAVESQAATPAAIVRELETSRHSERRGRAIDRDGAHAMERRKREGYF